MIVLGQWESDNVNQMITISDLILIKVTKLLVIWDLVCKNIRRLSLYLPKHFSLTFFFKDILGLFSSLKMDKIAKKIKTLSKQNNWTGHPSQSRLNEQQETVVANWMKFF